MPTVALRTDVQGAKLLVLTAASGFYQVDLLANNIEARTDKYPWRQVHTMVRYTSCWLDEANESSPIDKRQSNKCL